MAREYILHTSPLFGKDDHGQPRTPFPAQHLNNAAKALEELSNICTGILCDGEINNREAEFFRNWVIKHVQFSDIAWFDDLQSRVRQIFHDGRVDEDERRELHGIMELIRGGSDLAASYSNPLPLDVPVPVPIVFREQFFCITGRFAFGKRSKVMEVIKLLGGTASDSQPTQYTNYLVIGKFCSRDWLEQSYGTKIKRAVDLREQGCKIRIISEDHWREFLTQPSGQFGDRPHA